MIRSTAELLPQNLPHRKDRDIHKLYTDFDQFINAGWQSDILFWQDIFIKDDWPVKVPVFYFATPQTGPAVWDVSGVHGHQEPGGPEAIAKNAKGTITDAKNQPTVVIGLLNANYIKDNRYPDGQRVSLCDFDHLLLDTSVKTPRPRRQEPSNQYSFLLGEALLRLFEIYPPQILVDLHEDFPWPHEKRHYGKPHIYSDGPLGPDDPAAIETVRIFHRNGTRLRMHSKRGYFEKTTHGIATMHNGNLENLAGALFLWHDGRIIPGPACPTCLATETPTVLRGKRVDINKRIDTQIAVLAAIPHLLKIQRDNQSLYHDTTKYVPEFQRQIALASR